MQLLTHALFTHWTLEAIPRRQTLEIQSFILHPVPLLKLLLLLETLCFLLHLQPRPPSIKRTGGCLIPGSQKRALNHPAFPAAGTM